MSNALRYLTSFLLDLAVVPSFPRAELNDFLPFDGPTELKQNIRIRTRFQIGETSTTKIGGNEAPSPSPPPLRDRPSPRWTSRPTPTTPPPPSSRPSWSTPPRPSSRREPRSRPTTPRRPRSGPPPPPRGSRSRRRRSPSRPGRRNTSPSGQTSTASWKPSWRRAPSSRLTAPGM